MSQLDTCKDKLAYLKLLHVLEQNNFLIPICAHNESWGNYLIHLFVLHLFIDMKARPGTKLSALVVQRNRKKKKTKELRLDFRCLSSSLSTPCGRLCMNLRINLALLSVSPLQIVCLPLSPPWHRLSCLWLPVRVPQGSLCPVRVPLCLTFISQHPTGPVTQCKHTPATPTHGNRLVCLCGCQKQQQQWRTTVLSRYHNVA